MFAGRKYTFMVDSSEEGDEWILLLQEESKKRIKFMKKQTKSVTRSEKLRVLCKERATRRGAET